MTTASGLSYRDALQTTRDDSSMGELPNTPTANDTFLPYRGRYRNPSVAISHLARRSATANGQNSISDFETADDDDETLSDCSFDYGAPTFIDNDIGADGPEYSLNYNLFYLEFLDSAPKTVYPPMRRKASQANPAVKKIAEDFDPDSSAPFRAPNRRNSTGGITATAVAGKYVMAGAVSTEEPIHGKRDVSSIVSDDPYSFFEKWTSSVGVEACQAWVNRSPNKIGKRVCEKLISEVLQHITGMDPIRASELINIFEPDGRPSLNWAQLYIMLSFILAVEEARCCEFVFHHSAWLYMHYKQAGPFSIERTMAMIRFVNVPENHIQSVLGRLHMGFHLQAEFKDFQLLYFLMFDEWDQWISSSQTNIEPENEEMVDYEEFPRWLGLNGCFSCVSLI